MHELGLEVMHGRARFCLLRTLHRIATLKHTHTRTHTHTYTHTHILQQAVSNETARTKKQCTSVLDFRVSSVLDFRVLDKHLQQGVSCCQAFHMQKQSCVI